MGIPFSPRSCNRESDLAFLSRCSGSETTQQTDASGELLEARRQVQEREHQLQRLRSALANLLHQHQEHGLTMVTKANDAGGNASSLVPQLCPTPSFVPPPVPCADPLPPVCKVRYNNNDQTNIEVEQQQQQQFEEDVDAQPAGADRGRGSQTLGAPELVVATMLIGSILERCVAELASGSGEAVVLVCEGDDDGDGGERTDGILRSVSVAASASATDVMASATPTLPLSPLHSMMMGSATTLQPLTPPQPTMMMTSAEPPKPPASSAPSVLRVHEDRTPSDCAMVRDVTDDCDCDGASDVSVPASVSVDPSAMLRECSQEMAEFLSVASPFFSKDDSAFGDEKENGDNLGVAAAAAHTGARPEAVLPDFGRRSSMASSVISTDESDSYSDDDKENDNAAGQRINGSGGIRVNLGIGGGDDSHRIASTGILTDHVSPVTAPPHAPATEAAEVDSDTRNARGCGSGSDSDGESSVEYRDSFDPAEMFGEGIYSPSGIYEGGAETSWDEMSDGFGEDSRESESDPSSDREPSDGAGVDADAAESTWSESGVSVSPSTLGRGGGDSGAIRTRPDSSWIANANKAKANANANANANAKVAVDDDGHEGTACCFFSAASSSSSDAGSIAVLLSKTGTGSLTALTNAGHPTRRLSETAHP